MVGPARCLAIWAVAADTNQGLLIRHGIANRKMQSVQPLLPFLIRTILTPRIYLSPYFHLLIDDLISSVRVVILDESPIVSLIAAIALIASYIDGGIANADTAPEKLVVDLIATHQSLVDQLIAVVTAVILSEAAVIAPVSIVILVMSPEDFGRPTIDAVTMQILIRRVNMTMSPGSMPVENGRGVLFASHHLHVHAGLKRLNLSRCLLRGRSKGGCWPTC